MLPRMHNRSVSLFSRRRHFSTRVKSPVFYPLTSRRALFPKLSPLVQKRSYPVISFNLADIGEGISQVDVLHWNVQVGDMVEQFTPLCEVQSDKATVPITSRYSGKIVKIYSQVGEIAKVGSPLCDIEVDDGTPVSVSTPSPPPKPQAPTAVSEPINQSEDDISNTISTSSGTRKILATPAVRHLARKNKIELSRIVGSGKDGRVTKTDLIEHNKQPQPQPVLQQSKPTETKPKVTATQKTKLLQNKVVQLKGIQRAMAVSMTESLSIPHLGLSDEVDMTNLVNLREQIKQPMLEKGISISFLPFIIKASSMAMEQYPLINSKINKELSEITLLANHNIAIAVATPQGLVVPNIKNVQDLTIVQIAKELKRIIDLAQVNRLTVSDLSDSTFSLSNIGALGGTYASPVLVAPQVVIGAIGKIQKLPRFDAKGNVVAQQIMNISWSADHRVIDGATIASFSNLWKHYLENPGIILLEDLL